MGRRRGKGDEVSRLKAELERVKEERDILKKAASYFAKELK
jgi:transposase